MSAFIPPTPERRRDDVSRLGLFVGLLGLLLVVAAVSQAGSALGWW